MSNPTTIKAGRHFLQIPGPSNVPDSVLRAMAQPTMDHRGPDFPALTLGVLEKLKAKATKNERCKSIPDRKGTWARASRYMASPNTATTTDMCNPVTAHTCGRASVRRFNFRPTVNNSKVMPRSASFWSIAPLAMP